nr:hypothetical protein Iba_chr05aCG5780 [Ipomoea batatas]GMC97580.1 hypothetical protein Iba_chr05dCG8400 [Ipomoea batatas]GMD01441.1 hypothetical protein Iba_chr05fCG7440 [Ipomoea batatas]
MHNVCHNPAATSSTGVFKREGTQVGLSTSFVLPCPHCPYKPHPKVRSAPLSVITALCRPPHAMPLM